MLLALDVYYKENIAKTVGVCFHWEDEKPIDTFSTQIQGVEEYQSGQFYKRELPCLLTLLKQINLFEIEAIIVDGHCYIDNEKKLGLGGHLHKALNRKIPVIGIAKKNFHNTNKVSFPVYRGKSKNPLFISSIDVETKLVIDKVLKMHGNYRIPTILKILDRTTKTK